MKMASRSFDKPGFVLGFFVAAMLAAVLVAVVPSKARRTGAALDSPRAPYPIPPRAAGALPDPRQPTLASPAPPPTTHRGGRPTEAAALVSAAFREIDGGAYLAGRVLAERCLEADETNIQCHHAMVLSHIRQGDDEGAARPIDACLAVDPNDGWCLGALALGDLREGRFAEAGTVLEQLKRIDPGGVDTLSLEGSLAEKAHDVRGACEAFRKACSKGQPFACSRVEAICR